jgi:hypothetical protein
MTQLCMARQTFGAKAAGPKKISDLFVRLINDIFFIPKWIFYCGSDCIKIIGQIKFKSQRS